MEISGNAENNDYNNKILNVYSTWSQLRPSYTVGVEVINLILYMSTRLQRINQSPWRAATRKHCWVLKPDSGLPGHTGWIPPCPGYGPGLSLVLAAHHWSTGEHNKLTTVFSDSAAMGGHLTWNPIPSMTSSATLRTRFNSDLGSTTQLRPESMTLS